jgi:transposase
MSHFSKAIDEVRAGEARTLAASGRGELLKHTRWSLLKRPENLTERKDLGLRELVASNLKTVKANLLKESFQPLWDQKSPAWAGRFLDARIFMTIRSKIEPMKWVPNMIRRHQPLVLN